MKETISVNLASQAFTFDKDAYRRPVIRKFSTMWKPDWQRFSGPGFHRR